jgi:hypothetical protein
MCRIPEKIAMSSAISASARKSRMGIGSSVEKVESALF